MFLEGWIITCLATCISLTCGSNSIDDYSLSVLPDIDSQLVKDKSLIDINQLVKSVDQLFSHSEIAYYATIAYKANAFRDMALSICLDAMNLQNKTWSTFKTFNDVSKEVTEELKKAYQLMLDNEQKKANDIFQKIKEKAEYLASNVKQLCDEATDDREKVRGVLTQVFNSKDAQKEQKSTIDNEIQSLQVRNAKAEAERQNAEASAADARNRAEQARQDAEHEKRKKKKKCRGWKKLKCKLASAVNINLVKKHEKREKSYREEERKYLQLVQTHQENYRKAQEELHQVTAKMNELQKKIQSLEETAVGLQEVIKEYALITVTFEESYRYWSDMSSRCQSLQAVFLKEQMVSETLQKQAIDFYIQWMSIQSESQHYLSEAKTVSTTIPSQVSIDEAHKIIKQIKDEL